MNKQVPIQPSEHPTHQNTASILVVYHPDQHFSERLRRIAAQTRLIVIVNNGPKATLDNHLTEITHQETRIDLLQNSKNMGLGFALNQGVEHCLHDGYKWALLLDQDTEVDSDIVASLSSITASMSPLPAVIGANYRNNRNGRIFKSCSESDSGVTKRKTVITSGTLLNLKTHILIGPFMDNYFIDSIDHEYCLRARSNGFPIYISCKPLMTHHIGTEFNTASYLQRLLRAPDHSPARKYYIARNTITTMKIFWRSETTWCLKQALRLTSEVISIMLFEDSKVAKLSSTMNGMVDGILGRPGPGPLE